MQVEFANVDGTLETREGPIVYVPGDALLTGVEAILQAAPSGSQAMMLSPWSLGGPSGDAQNQ